MNSLNGHSVREVAITSHAAKIDRIQLWRHKMRSIVAASLLSVVMISVAAAEPEVPIGAKSRKFEFSYTATIKTVPDSAKTVELWIPIPQSDKYQDIGNIKFHVE